MIFFRGKAGKNLKLRERQVINSTLSTVLKSNADAEHFTNHTISFAIHIQFHPFSTHPSHLCEMPGSTPEKRPRKDTQAQAPEAEATIPKCEVNMSKTVTARSVLQFAKLSQNAYAPTKGKDYHFLLMSQESLQKTLQNKCN